MARSTDTKRHEDALDVVLAMGGWFFFEAVEAFPVYY